MNGQLLPINQCQALFSLLGTTFGGDGRTTFALPLAKPVLTLTQGAGLIQGISLTGIYPSRS
ncbi:tail fiber protein [Methylocella tundrae]|uniref:tail fiber protein n=1 Tax=Methylocella tundrae TaxID=227605 RepID=UPI003BF8AC51